MKAKKRTTSDLFINNLQSFYSNSPNNPTTEFAVGEKIELKWESNGTNFKVYKKNDTSAIYDGKNKFTTISNIFTNSTFVVKATLDGMVMYASITITISNPDLKPKSVVTANDETIKGSLTINGTSTLKNATVKEKLTVNGSSNFENIIANGDATIKKLTVNGDTSINGKFSTKGAVSIFKNCNSPIVKDVGIPLSRLETTTDGILVMSLDPGDVGSFKYSYTIGQIYYADRWFQASAYRGEIYFNNKSLLASLPNTLSIPIAANTKCWIRGYNYYVTNPYSYISFYWFPLGDSKSTPKIIHDPNAAIGKIQIPQIDPKVMIAEHKVMIAERKNKADEFVSLLEQAADKKFNKAIKKELAKRLLDL